MPSKKKGKSTLDTFYGYSTMEKPSNFEDISHVLDLNVIPDLNDEPNKDIEEDLVDDLEMFDHQKRGSSSEGKRKNLSKHEF